MTAIVDPHVPSVCHSTNKGLTAGMRSPHSDTHDAHLGESHRNLPAAQLQTGNPVGKATGYF